MRVRIQIEGQDEVLRALQKLNPAMKQRLRPRLIAWGEKVLAAAKPLVPVGEDDPYPGTLRESGRVLKPVISATRAKLTVSVQFGGAEALAPNVRRGQRKDTRGYAVIQHENLTLHHDDGEAKFLERPFVAAAPEVPELVTASVDEAAAEV